MARLAFLQRQMAIELNPWVDARFSGESPMGQGRLKSRHAPARLGNAFASFLLLVLWGASIQFEKFENVRKVGGTV